MVTRNSRITKLISTILVVCLLSFMTACNSKIKADYKDAATYEAALNNGEDTVGKTVTFSVDNYIPDGTLGYTIWSGEHLNFISYTNPNCQIGDTMTVEVTKVYNVLGHWLIYYNLVEDSSEPRVTSELEANLPGTYYGVNGSVLILNATGSAAYYWTEWDSVDQTCTWSSGDGTLFVTIPSCLAEVRADLSDSAGFYLEGATESDQLMWDPEYYIKVSDDTSVPSAEDCQAIIRSNIPTPTPVETDLEFVDRTYLGFTFPVPSNLADFERNTVNGYTLIRGTYSNDQVEIYISYSEIDSAMLNSAGDEGLQAFYESYIDSFLTTVADNLTDYETNIAYIDDYICLTFDSNMRLFGYSGEASGLLIYIPDNGYVYEIHIFQKNAWAGEDYLIARDYILQNAHYNQT